MKSLFVGVVALVGLSGMAVAADLPARTYTKAPAYIAAAYDWSGFYIGANGGYGSSRKCWDYSGITGARLVTNVAEGCHDATGGVAGGQIGYNWQMSSLVFGLEAQGDWADLKGSNNSLAFTAFTNRSRIDAFGLFTGRVGYAWNNALLYVKGGAAVANDKYNYYPTATGITTATASETRWGAMAGGGLEYGFTPNWSFAVEYDHIFLGARDLTFTPAGVPATQVVERIKQDVDVVTARVNYRWGGPVVAKY